MVDFIIIAALVLILGGAGYYVYKVKKSGKKCIGCPESSCPHAGTAQCSCGKK